MQPRRATAASFHSGLSRALAAPPANGSRPLILYAETAPQHFPASSQQRTRAPAGDAGLYKGPQVPGAAAGECQHELSGINAYARSERKELKGVLPFFPMQELLLGAGGAHTTVGGKDCTHWCQPGPLEAYVAPLLAEQITQLMAAHDVDVSQCPTPR